MTPVTGGDRLKLSIQRIETKIATEKLKDYVLSRKSDGGFSFCKPLPPSLAETYYAIYILRAIDALEEIDCKSMVEYLKENLRDEAYSVFYVLSSLNLMNKELPDKKAFIHKRIQEIIGNYDRSRRSREIGGTLGNIATYSFESPSILRELCILTSSLMLYPKQNAKTKENEVLDLTNFISKFRRGNGYSVKSSPNLRDTFYCISISRGEVERKGEVIKFILDHEYASGGFSKSPKSFPPYLEDSYYAVKSLEVLGYAYRSTKTASYLASLQNPDGGFRRSIHGGISTLENSFYAVSSLVSLLKD